jgi:hypothetical protein
MTCLEQSVSWEQDSCTVNRPKPKPQITSFIKNNGTAKSTEHIPRNVKPTRNKQGGDDMPQRDQTRKRNVDQKGMTNP